MEKEVLELNLKHKKTQLELAQATHAYTKKRNASLSFLKDPNQ
jgi:hypothetical protein